MLVTEGQNPPGGLSAFESVVFAKGTKRWDGGVVESVAVLLQIPVNHSTTFINGLGVGDTSTSGRQAVRFCPVEV